jgi:hypothetical protein
MKMKRKKSFIKKLIWTLVGFKLIWFEQKIITEARLSFQPAPSKRKQTVAQKTHKDTDNFLAHGMMIHNTHRTKQ